MVTLLEVITFLVSMQISISSWQTHNANRCGRSRHLTRKLNLSGKRSIVGAGAEVEKGGDGGEIRVGAVESGGERGGRVSRQVARKVSDGRNRRRANVLDIAEAAAITASGLVEAAGVGRRGVVPF